MIIKKIIQFQIELATTGENNLVILAISATVIAVVILGIKIKKSI